MFTYPLKANLKNQKIINKVKLFDIRSNRFITLILFIITSKHDLRLTPNHQNQLILNFEIQENNIYLQKKFKAN